MRTSDRILRTIERVVTSPGWSYVPWRFMVPYRPVRTDRHAVRPMTVDRRHG